MMMSNTSSNVSDDIEVISIVETSHAMNITAPTLTLNSTGGSGSVDKDGHGPTNDKSLELAGKLLQGHVNLDMVSHRIEALLRIHSPGNPVPFRAYRSIKGWDIPHSCFRLPTPRWYKCRIDVELETTKVFEDDRDENGNQNPKQSSSSIKEVGPIKMKTVIQRYKCQSNAWQWLSARDPTRYSNIKGGLQPLMIDHMHAFIMTKTLIRRL